LLINTRGGTTVKEGGNFGEGEKQTTDSRGVSLRKTEEKRAKNRRAGRIFLKEKVRETERERPLVFFLERKRGETERKRQGSERAGRRKKEKEKERERKVRTEGGK
jgi:hypothetical protein